MNQVQKTKEWLPTAAQEFSVVVKPKEYTDLISCQSPKFLQVSDKYGMTSLETIVAHTLSSLSEGLGFTVTGEMLSDAAELIIQEYPDTKLSDLLLFKSKMLIGRIGGQIEDKLWKWNTRSILQAWGDYYREREECLADIREQWHNERSNELEKPSGKDIPMPDYVKKNFDDLIAKKRIDNILKDQNRKTPNHKLTLEQIAENEGIDISVLSVVIVKKAEEKKADSEEPLHLFSTAEITKVTFEARKNPEYLHEYIKT